MADGADFLDVGGVKAGPGRAGRRGRGAGAGRAGGRGAGGAVRPADLGRHVAVVACWTPPSPPVRPSATTSVASPTRTTCRVAAKHGASVVATHIRLAPRVPDPAPEYPEGVVEAVVRFCAERARVGGGGRHPPGADHGRRRPRPREDRAHVARAAPGVRPAGRARLPGVPVGLQQALPRRGARPRRSTSDGWPRSPPTPRASPSAAGCCGPTTCAAAGGWPTSWPPSWRRRAAAGAPDG